MNCVNNIYNELLPYIVEFLSNCILSPIFIILSIGLSDMIEFWISPAVHQYHNCPDIMKMKWNNYKSIHAFLSGIKCSYFLIALCIFNHTPLFTLIWFCINIAIPLICYLTGLDKRNMFYSHMMLYITNFYFVLRLISKNKYNLIIYKSQH